MVKSYLVAFAFAGSAESYGWRRKAKVIRELDGFPVDEEVWKLAEKEAREWVGQLPKDYAFEGLSVLWEDTDDFPLPRWIER